MDLRIILYLPVSIIHGGRGVKKNRGPEKSWGPRRNNNLSLLFPLRYLISHQWKKLCIVLTINGVSLYLPLTRKIKFQRRRPMNEQNEVKTQKEVLFDCLKELYRDRFSPEMQNDLKAAMETVVKTVMALRSVPMNSYGDLSLSFTPFRKEH